MVPFDGGPIEEAVRSQEVRVFPPEPRRTAADGPELWRVLAPVTQRGEVIGLLEFVLPDEPHQDSVGRDRPARAPAGVRGDRQPPAHRPVRVGAPAHAAAEPVRRDPHRLLPGPQTCEAGAFTLAGWLEPAAGIAGDTFDYSLARDELHLSLTDAMGHGVAAALAATLCVGSLRNARAEGASLLEQVHTTNQSLLEHAAASALEDFVTGLIGRVDLRTGSMELVNAAHVAPYLARGDDVSTLDLPVDLPLGLFAESTYRASRITLEPGDRVVFVTDGMLERNAVDVDLAAEIRATRALHPREAVRVLADRVLDATGHALSDDATVLCVDWHGGHGRDRGSVRGAERGRVSRPLT
ncbi:PP2C family protein-serine/threonine phosphatase [Nocardioides ungokensis]|uniref:PP2C family protein-serine/threonine phosphatase n=1 Tax=Nocardioides ungokensis TaxID=1643322 RepID=UPI001C60AD99|nr:PP2C family protein-serine/threonine phosphatase [Nocardioides ungokensis]